jgi:hypothetical protein
MLDQIPHPRPAHRDRARNERNFPGLAIAIAIAQARFPELGAALRLAAAEKLRHQFQQILQPALNTASRTRLHRFVANR